VDRRYEERRGGMRSEEEDWGGEMRSEERE
jgi:hypothetical protein